MQLNTEIDHFWRHPSLHDVIFTSKGEFMDRIIIDESKFRRMPLCENVYEMIPLFPHSVGKISVFVIKDRTFFLTPKFLYANFTRPAVAHLVGDEKGSDITNFELGIIIRDLSPFGRSIFSKLIEATKCGIRRSDDGMDWLERAITLLRRSFPNQDFQPCDVCEDPLPFGANTSFKRLNTLDIPHIQRAISTPSPTSVSPTMSANHLGSNLRAGESNLGRLCRIPRQECPPCLPIPSSISKAKIQNLPLISPGITRTSSAQYPSPPSASVSQPLSPRPSSSFRMRPQSASSRGELPPSGLTSNSHATPAANNVLSTASNNDLSVSWSSRRFPRSSLPAASAMVSPSFLPANVDNDINPMPSSGRSRPPSLCTVNADDSPKSANGMDLFSPAGQGSKRNFMMTHHHHLQPPPSPVYAAGYPSNNLHAAGSSTCPGSVQDDQCSSTSSTNSKRVSRMMVPLTPSSNTLSPFLHPSHLQQHTTKNVNNTYANMNKILNTNSNNNKRKQDEDEALCLTHGA